MHVEMGLASMFGFRPTPALSGYRVPGLPGLYLAGASTHPGGGVSGYSGRTAARVAAGRPRGRCGARCAGSGSESGRVRHEHRRRSPACHRDALARWCRWLLRVS